MSIRGLAIGLFAAVVSIFGSDRAEALDIWVEGQLYRLTENLAPYDVSEAFLETQPFFGDADFAVEFRNQFKWQGQAQGFFDTVTGSEYMFAYEEFTKSNGKDAVRVTSLAIGQDGNYFQGGNYTNGILNRDFNQDRILSQDRVVFFMSAAAIVPEIDGPVMAQLGLVLGAGYLGLRARRRKSAVAAA